MPYYFAAAISASTAPGNPAGNGTPDAAKLVTCDNA